MATQAELRFCQRQLIAQRPLSADKPRELRPKRELAHNGEVRLTLALTFKEIEHGVHRVTLVLLIWVELNLHSGI